MWRDIDPRAQERERPELGLGRVGGYTEMESGQVSDDPRARRVEWIDAEQGVVVRCRRVDQRKRLLPVRVI